MSFFRKFLGLRDRDLVQAPENSSDFNIEVNVKLVSAKTVEEPAVEGVTSKSYDIIEVKKQSTVIKNDKGLTESINFITNFISSNEIEFLEFVSLMKKAIPYMKKEKSKADFEIIEYLNAQIEKFPITDKPENQIEIAHLFQLVDNQFAIEFLENILGSNQNPKNNSLDQFDLLFRLSSYYLDEEQSDKAFQANQRANLVLFNCVDKFELLNKQFLTIKRSAEICLNGDKCPTYGDYFYYEVAAYIIEIATRIIGFPAMRSFYLIRNSSLSIDSNSFNYVDFDNAIDHLNIMDKKAEIVQSIHEFSFNVLPILMGVPEEYIKDNGRNNESPDAMPLEQKYAELKEKRELIERFRQTPFEIVWVYDFVGELMEKFIKD